MFPIIRGRLFLKAGSFDYLFNFLHVLYVWLLRDAVYFSGYKKDVTKILKGLVGLYSSFSSEVVSVLLELLLNTKSSSDSLDLPENTQKDPSIYTSLNEWKLVITKFSNKKPELRLALLNAVLDMIETQEEMMGNHFSCFFEFLFSLLSDRYW